MQVDAMMDQDDNFNGYSVGLPGFFTPVELWERPLDAIKKPNWEFTK
jgi:hypothetical protein